MARVLIVCVAGVSGTFLARRMRQLAPELEPLVTPLDSVGRDGRRGDAVLLAPQLATQLVPLRDLLEPVPVALLPIDAFRSGGAEAAVRQARDLLSAEAYGGTPIPEKEE